MKKDKIFPIITSLFVTIIVFGGTALVFLYANGYRFNREEGTLDKTGVISISARPYRSDIHLDGKDIGKTPKTISSLKEGSHNVVVSREGYHDWVKNVMVQVEKSTPIYAHLFRSELEAEELFKIDNEIVEIYADSSDNYTFVITKKDLGGATTESPTPPTNSFYQIWRYNINPGFWELAQNPVLLYEQELANSERFDLLISPNGQTALLTTSSLDTAATTPAQSITHQLLNTGRKNDEPNLVDLSAFEEGYEISWAADNHYLVMESDSELVTFDTTSDTRYIIRRNDLPVAWSSNKDGRLLLIDKVELPAAEPTDNVAIPTTSKFVVRESTMQGNNSAVIIDEIYTINELTTDIKQFQEPVTRAELQTPFVSSEVGMKLSGDITGIIENEIEDTFILQTTLATYWYTLEDNRYVLMLPEPSQYIGNASNQEMLAIEGATALAIFTFDKEEADHTAVIGTKIIKTYSKEADISRMKWVSDSEFLSYAFEETLFVIDSDGDNNIELTPLVGDFYMIDRGGRFAYTLSSPSQELSSSTSLIRYEIE